MAGQSSERMALITHIRERWPRMSAEQAEEFAHEALVRALAAAPQLRGSTLLAKAKEHLAGAASDDFWRRRRLPTSNIDAVKSKPGSTVETMPRERRRVGARRPKGLLPCHGSQHGFQLVEIGTGEMPNPELRLGAFLLRTLLLESIEAQAVLPPHVGEAFMKLFRQLFGHAPSDAWANALINQISDAKLADIAPRERARSPASPRKQPTLMFVQKDQPKVQREAVVRTQVLSRRGPLAEVACYGDLGNGRGEQLLGTATVMSGLEAVRYPRDARERAQLVLALTIRTLACFPVPCPIPEYALDVELVIWLEMRMGFNSGGGPHSMSRQKLLDLLIDPAQLATAIESHGRRMARRAPGDSVLLKAATQALASRVRTRALATKSY